jgi:Leucine-rich repeat (LRR) protein
MAVALLLEEEDYEFDDDVRYEDFFNKKFRSDSFFFSYSDTLDYSHQNLTEIDPNALFSTIENPDCIKNFHLNSNSLFALPNEIEKFQSLITLEVSNNQLVQIPHAITLLKNLKHLFLKNNSLDDFSLPKEIEQLKQLEIINLGGNRFKQFPYQLFQMFNLKEIYLGSNQITILPDLFQTLTK